MISTTLSDFRKDIKTYIDKVNLDYDTVIINRGKDEGVVLMSLAKYNSLSATNHELSSKTNRDRINSELEKFQKKEGVEKELSCNIFLWMNHGKIIYIGKKRIRKIYKE